jgi:hypothetical protein
LWIPIKLIIRIKGEVSNIIIEMEKIVQRNGFNWPGTG